MKITLGSNYGVLVACLEKPNDTRLHFEIRSFGMEVWLKLWVTWKSWRRSSSWSINRWQQGQKLEKGWASKRELEEEEEDEDEGKDKDCESRAKATEVMMEGQTDWKWSNMKKGFVSLLYCYNLNPNEHPKFFDRSHRNDWPKADKIAQPERCVQNTARSGPISDLMHNIEK